MAIQRPQMTPTPQPSPPESPEREQLRKAAELIYRTGMAQIRTAQGIKRYLAETAPGGMMTKTKEGP